MTRILIVEDNPLNMDLMKTILSANGFEHLSAINGEISIDMATQHEIDLILMDLQMPGIDGFEAMRLIREIDGYRDVPIIAVTGNTTEADATQAENQGFNGFLSKPFKIKDLLSSIASLIEKQP